MNNQIYLIDKPSGITSFDVIRTMRKQLGIRKMGHAGTLDPMATGLLIVATGRLTRLSDYFHRYDKSYRAVIRLGMATDTDDLAGNVLAEKSLDSSTVEESGIRSILTDMIGTIAQRVPAISAKRVNGRRLYDANRNGVAVEAPVATVTIYDIHVEKIALPEVEVTVRCGSGTYIRAIARDLGAALGVGGTLASLRRTRIGPYEVENASALDQEDLVPLPHREILPELDAVVPDDRQRKRILAGSAVRMKGLSLPEGTRIRIFGPYLSELEAICRVTSSDGRGCGLQPERVFKVMA